MKTQMNKIAILIAGLLMMLTNSCELADDLVENATISKITGD